MAKGAGARVPLISVEILYTLCFYSKHNELQVAGVWNAKDELPIEIDLPQECRYHSVFACPILRQQVITPPPPSGI
jgi:hypothetical protein